MYRVHVFADIIYFSVGKGSTICHLTGHIFIGVAAGFFSSSMPSGGYPQAGLSAALGVVALRAATDSKFTVNSYF